MTKDSKFNLCFFEFSNTFEVVNHQISSAKLTAQEAFDYRVIWINSSRSAIAFLVGIDSLLFNEAAAPSGILQGSVIGPLLFLVMINYLPGELQLFCSMLTDDTKTGAKNANVN